MEDIAEITTPFMKGGISIMLKKIMKGSIITILGLITADTIYSLGKARTLSLMLDYDVSGKKVYSILSKSNSLKSKFIIKCADMMREES